MAYISRNEGWSDILDLNDGDISATFERNGDLELEFMVTEYGCCSVRNQEHTLKMTREEAIALAHFILEQSAKEEG